MTEALINKENLSEQQKITFDEVSKKINDFLKTHGIDNDGVDYLTEKEDNNGSYESKEEKNLEGELEKKKGNIEAQLLAMKNFLDFLKLRNHINEVKKKLNDELTKKIPKKIETTEDKIIDKYIESDSLVETVENNFGDKKEKYDKKIKNITDKKNLLSAKVGENFSLFSQTKDFQKLKDEFNNINYINKIYNQENSKISELKNINNSKTKQYFESRIGVISKENIENNTKMGNIISDLTNVNFQYEDTNNSLNSLKERLAYFSNLSNLKLENIDGNNTLDIINKQVKEIEEEIKKYEQKLNKYEQDRKKLENNLKDLYIKIDNTNKKAEEINKELEQGFFIKYNGEEVKLDELLKIKETSLKELEDKSINILENSKSEKNTQDQDLNKEKIKKPENTKNSYINNTVLKDIKDEKIKTAILEYGRKDEISKKDLEKLSGLILLLNNLKDSGFGEYNDEINLDYINARTELIKFLKTTPKAKDLFKLKEIITKYTNKYKTETLNPVINDAEKKGKKAPIRNTLLGFIDKLTGNYKHIAKQYITIANNILNIKNKLEHKKYNPKYKNILNYIKNQIKKYDFVDKNGKIDIDKFKIFYKKITQNGNFTKKQESDLNKLENKINSIKTVLERQDFNEDKKIDILNTVFLNIDDKNLKTKKLNLDTKFKEILEKSSELHKEMLNKHYKKLFGEKGKEKKLTYDDIKHFNKFLDNYQKLIKIEEKVKKINPKSDIIKEIEGILNKYDINNSDNSYINAINALNKEAINLGIDEKQYDDTLKELYDKIKINDNILKDYSSLYKLKDNNKYLFLEIISDISKKSKNKEEIKQNLELWNKIIKDKINNSKDGETKNWDLQELSNEYLNKKLNENKDEEKLVAFNNNEALNFINKNLDLKYKILPIKKNFNSDVASKYKREALIMLNQIDKNEKNSWWTDEDKINNTKKLIKFAIEENAFGDIRVINTLRVIGEKYDKKSLEKQTNKQLSLETKYYNKKTGEFDYYRGETIDDAKILVNNKKDNNLLEEANIKDFKNDFITSLTHGDIVAFIGAHPKATISFLSFFVKNPKILSIKEQLLLASKYEKFFSNLNNKNNLIIEAAGGNTIFTELRRRFGEDGEYIMREQLENQFKSLLEEGKSIKEKNKILEELKDVKDMALKLLEQSNFSPKQKDFLKKAIIEGNIKNIREIMKSIKSINGVYENIKNIISNNLTETQKKNSEIMDKINNILNEESSEILSKEKLEKNITNKITKLAEYLNSLDIPKNKINSIGKEILKLNSIGNKKISNLFTNILTKLKHPTQKDAKTVKDINKKSSNSEVTSKIAKEVKDITNQTEIKNSTKEYINSKNYEQIKKELEEKNKNIDILTNQNTTEEEKQKARNELNKQVKESEKQVEKEYVTTILKSANLTNSQKRNFVNEYKQNNKDLDLKENKEISDLIKSYEETNPTDTYKQYNSEQYTIAENGIDTKNKSITLKDGTVLDNLSDEEIKDLDIKNGKIGNKESLKNLLNMKKYLEKWNLGFIWDNRELFLEYVANKEGTANKIDLTNSIDKKELNWFIKGILGMVGIEGGDTLYKTEFAMRKAIEGSLNINKTNINTNLGIIGEMFYKKGLIGYGGIINDPTKIRTWDDEKFKKLNYN